MLLLKYHEHYTTSLFRAKQTKLSFSQIMIELVYSEQETETELNLPETNTKKVIFTSESFKFLPFFQANLILVPFPPHRQVLSIIPKFKTCFTTGPCYIFYFAKHY